MNKVVRFEIPAKDLANAKEFYGQTFGWQITEWGKDYLSVFSSEADEKGNSKVVGTINGGIQKKGSRAVAVTVVIETDDIDTCLTQVKANGGTVVIKKEKIADMGYYAQFEDPEGNRLGLFQSI